MHILYISPYFHPTKGGSQYYSEELYATMMKQSPDVQVDVICYNLDQAPTVEQYRGFTIYRLPCWDVIPGQFTIPNYIELWKLLRKLFKKNRYNVMNSNTRFFENSWWVPFVAKWQKTPSILTDHCAHHPTHHTHFVSWVARIVDRTIAPLVSHLYNLVTVTNKATQRFVESIGMKKPTLVYGGVDTTFFHPHKRQKKRIVPHVPHHIGEKKTLVTFVGRMIPSKGPHILYDIAINLLEKYPNVEFVFAGDGPLRTRLAEKNTSDRIHIIGPLEKTDIAQLFANSDIVVHPSLHHEGFPNVLLEAGASGCALIATDMGGTRELVKHEKSGLLVKPEMKELQTALASLLTDTKKQRTFQKSIRHLAETQFSWKKIAQQYKKLLSQY